MIRPRTVSEWLTVALIALVVVAAFAAPMAVIRNSHDETERILARFETESEVALNRAIRVNVLTISCLLLIPEEDRSEEDLDRCIRAGFDDVGTPD